MILHNKDDEKLEEIRTEAAKSNLKAIYAQLVA